jgi:hypothetical protein
LVAIATMGGLSASPAAAGEIDPDSFDCVFYREVYLPLLDQGAGPISPCPAGPSTVCELGASCPGTLPGEVRG